MTPGSPDILAAARRLADDVLFPDAMRVDGLDSVPPAHLDALAAEGLYGASAPQQAGGLGLDLTTACAVTEELAGGCLATTFVWLQHRGLTMTLAAQSTPATLRDQWLAPACRGKVRGGIALTGLIPGPPRLRARPAEDGWRVDGAAPWVTGWGLIDLLLVVARGPGDSVVSLILDAVAQPGLTVTRQRLAAVNASVTVQLDFDGVMVPRERLAGQEPFDPAADLRPDRLRINGSLALGVAGRCARLMGPGPLDDELAACRTQLDSALDADVAAMAQARAAASELAVRSAAALAVRDGSKSIMADQHPPRLTREALFLLVFGSRPPIKSALLRRLGDGGLLRRPAGHLVGPQLAAHTHRPGGLATRALGGRTVPVPERGGVHPRLEGLVIPPPGYHEPGRALVGRLEQLEALETVLVIHRAGPGGEPAGKLVAAVGGHRNRVDPHDCHA